MFQNTSQNIKPNYYCFKLKYMKTIITFLSGFLFVATLVQAQNSNCLFKDNQGGTIEIQTGKLAFVDEVVKLKSGSPTLHPDHPRRKFRNITGAPNYLKYRKPHQNVLSLGCGGTIILKFNNNGLVDGEGDDLVVFEIGYAIEPTFVSVSEDGKNWIDIGKIEGHTASIDLANHVDKSQVFFYVRLKDLYTKCEGKHYDGADIDAVAALNSISIIDEPIFTNTQKSDIEDIAVSDNFSDAAIKKNIELVKVNEQFGSLTIYPNPAQYNLNIEFDLQENTEVSIDVYDQQGKKLGTVINKEKKPSGNHIVNYSLDRLEAGIYYIQLKTDQGYITKKLIKH